MKRKISKSFFIVAIASTFILGSCKNDSQNSVPRLFEENPATVTWETSKTDCIDFNKNIMNNNFDKQLNKIEKIIKDYTEWKIKFDKKFNLVM